MIYLCIPAHDEETTIGVVLWKVRQIMAELPRDYQLLVADDGSTDRTSEVLEPYTRILPLTVMRTDERRGYAASVEMLLREAVSRSDYPKRDAVVVLQADFTQDPGHLPNLIKRIESGADIVVSEATHPAGASRRDRLGRSICLRVLRGIGWPEETFDPLTGYNAYRLFCIKRAIEEAEGGRLLSWEGPLANAELLRAAAPHARRVDSVEFEPRPDRRQRETRASFMPALRGVIAFRRGLRPEPGLSTDLLRPTRVVNASSAQRSLVAESLRGASSRDRGGAQRGRRPPSGTARSSGSTRKRTGTDSPGGGTKERGSRGKPRRRSSGGRRKNSDANVDAVATDGQVVDPDTAANGGAAANEGAAGAGNDDAAANKGAAGAGNDDAAASDGSASTTQSKAGGSRGKASGSRRRSSGSRRRSGGSRRKTGAKQSDDGDNDGTTGPTSGQAPTDAESAGPTGESGGGADDGAGRAAGQGQRRRSRGRRGGRRRRRSRGGSADSDKPTSNDTRENGAGSDT